MIENITTWERRLFAAFAAELRPSPTRWRATIRVMLATVFALAVGLLAGNAATPMVIIAIFTTTSSRNDAQAALESIVYFTAGFVIGGTLAIALMPLLGDKKGMVVALTSFTAFAVAYLVNTQDRPQVYSGIAFSMFGLLPDRIATIDGAAEAGFQEIVTVAGAAAFTAYLQFALWREDVSGRHLAVVADSLDRVARWLGRLADGKAPGTRDWLVREGMAAQLDLIDRAEANQPALQPLHEKQTNLVVDVDRVVYAALRLHLAGEAMPDQPAVRAAIRTLATAASRAAADIRGRQPYRAEPPILAAAQDASLPPRSRACAAALADLTPATAYFAQTTLPPSRGVRPIPLPRFHLPSPVDAMALHAAIKATLCVAILGLLYQAMDWPGIDTCMITALLIQLNTRGATLRKSALRICGATAGALCAILVLPVMAGDPHGPLGRLFIPLPIFLFAAYLNAGSTRISYGGYQLAYAYALVLYSSPAKAVANELGLDRAAGVLLGIAVWIVIDSLMWSVSATRIAAAKFDIVDRLTTTLAAMRPADPGRHDVRVRQHRAYKAGLAALDDARFELKFDAAHERRIADLESRVVAIREKTLAAIAPS